MRRRGWCGQPGAYQAILPGTAGGGGLFYSLLRRGVVQAILPGTAGGGGQQSSSAAVRPGCSGGGNTGPGTGNRI